MNNTLLHKYMRVLIIFEVNQVVNKSGRMNWEMFKEEFWIIKFSGRPDLIFELVIFEI